MPTAKLKAILPKQSSRKKLEALVSLGVANSRMKDFFDLWAISQTFAFEEPCWPGDKSDIRTPHAALLRATAFTDLSEFPPADPAQTSSMARLLASNGNRSGSRAALLQLIPAISAFLTPVLWRRVHRKSPPRIAERAAHGENSMSLIGYATRFNEDQSTDAQIDVLKVAGCAEIFREHMSGAKRHGELAKVLARVRRGDVLVVVRLDRLARVAVAPSFGHRRARRQGAHFKSLADPIDTTTPQGRFALQVLGAVANWSGR